jgi:hypothetical protein
MCVLHCTDSTKCTRAGSPRPDAMADANYSEAGGVPPEVPRAGGAGAPAAAALLFFSSSRRRRRSAAS